MAARIGPLLLVASLAALGQQKESAGMVSAALPESILMPPPSVGVLLRFERKPGSGFVKDLRREVEAIFRPAGLDMHWEVLDQRTQPKTYDRIVVVEMRGACNLGLINQAGGPAQERSRLGSTRVQEGEVLPFSMVDCDQIARAVWNSRGNATGRLLLPVTYRRLTGRVMAHELLHALLRTRDHRESDCARAMLITSDLPQQARLVSSEVAALRRIGLATLPSALAEGPKPGGPGRPRGAGQ